MTSQCGPQRPNLNKTSLQRRMPGEETPTWKITEKNKRIITFQQKKKVTYNGNIYRRAGNSNTLT